MTTPVDDLSVYILAGRITRPAEGIEDGDAAQELGLKRVWLSERYDLKEAGAILGGIAARTSTLGVATSAIVPGSRHPLLTAALGATMQATYGPRFTLGIGRGIGAVLGPQGMQEFGYQALADYVDIVRRLWAGETVEYRGPAGDYPSLKLVDRFDAPPPEVWFVNLGGERSSRLAARIFDGVFLTPFLTPNAVAATVGWIRDECERIGRDPAQVRICHPVVTAPEFDDAAVRELAHARAVTYLQFPGVWQTWIRLNGWDAEIVDKVRNHPIFSGLQRSTAADQHFHRSELATPAELVPDSWMAETSAIGSLDRCCDLLQSYKDVGVDEIAIYGSRPAENARLVEAWRRRTHGG